MANFDYQDFDREIWNKDLEDFVPSTVYDMHTHMWSETHRGSLTGEALGLRTEINYQDHLNWAAKLYPDREFHLLVLGTPIVRLRSLRHWFWQHYWTLVLVFWWRAASLRRFGVDGCRNI